MNTQTKKAKKTEGGQSFKDAIQSAFAAYSMLIAFIVSRLLYVFILGNRDNFQAGDSFSSLGEGFFNQFFNLVFLSPERGAPIPGNFLAMMYKGGFIVPILMTCVLTILIFLFERMIMLRKARGAERINIFVKKIQELLSANKIEEAMVLCDKQKGSLANIVRAALVKYRPLQEDQTLEKEQKILSLQKELEEATALELPMLSKNLVIFSTLASISVLIGLIGTVLGMIRAFAALAQAGAPDALALATGISEALINTAFGITGSTLAIIFFNVFSSKIDAFTYKIDEANFSIVQTFASTTK